MLQKKNEGILFSAEIRVVGSYTDRLLSINITGAISGVGDSKRGVHAVPSK